MKALLVPAIKQNTQLQLLFYPNKNSHYCNVCISSFTWRQCRYSKLDPNKLESEKGKKTTHEKTYNMEIYRTHNAKSKFMNGTKEMRLHLYTNWFADHKHLIFLEVKGMHITATTGL